MEASVCTIQPTEPLKVPKRTERPTDRRPRVTETERAHTDDSVIAPIHGHGSHRVRPVCVLMSDGSARHVVRPPTCADVRSPRAAVVVVRARVRTGGGDDA